MPSDSTCRRRRGSTFIRFVRTGRIMRTRTTGPTPGSDGTVQTLPALKGQLESPRVCRVRPETVGRREGADPSESGLRFEMAVRLCEYSDDSPSLPVSESDLKHVRNVANKICDVGQRYVALQGHGFSLVWFPRRKVDRDVLCLSRCFTNAVSSISKGLHEYRPSIWFLHAHRREAPRPLLVVSWRGLKVWLLS